MKTAKRTNGQQEATGKTRKNARKYTGRNLQVRLAKRLREGREAQGLTLKGLAAKAGLAQSTVCRIEYGEVSPTINQLSLLASKLGTKASALLQEVQG